MICVATMRRCLVNSSWRRQTSFYSWSRWNVAGIKLLWKYFEKQPESINSSFLLGRSVSWICQSYICYKTSCITFRARQSYGGSTHKTQSADTFAFWIINRIVEWVPVGNPCAKTIKENRDTQMLVGRRWTCRTFINHDLGEGKLRLLFDPRLNLWVWQVEETSLLLSLTGTEDSH